METKELSFVLNTASQGWACLSTTSLVSHTPRLRQLLQNSMSPPPPGTDSIQLQSNTPTFAQMGGGGALL